MIVLTIVMYLLLVQSIVDAKQQNYYNKTKEKINNFVHSTTENIFNLFSNNVSTDSMRLLLYTRNIDIPVTISENNATAEIDLKIDTIFIIHGWTDNGTSPWIKKAAKRLHQAGQFNIIAVDWSILASGDYFTAVSTIDNVGYRIKNFIKAVNISVKTVLLIGHSLGAQVSAYVAKALNPEKVKRIDGLDPAGPLFDIPIPLPSPYRLTSGDAEFVQVIHTCILFRGVTIPCGTIDFYVNKGANQPGCSSNRISCSHQIVHTFYILTISNATKYKGTKWCPLKFLGCQSNTAFMGFGVDTAKSGVFNVRASDPDVDLFNDF